MTLHCSPGSKGFVSLERLRLSTATAHRYELWLLDQIKRRKEWTIEFLVDRESLRVAVLEQMFTGKDDMNLVVSQLSSVHIFLNAV